MAEQNPLLGKREVRAPTEDWLTQTQVLNWFSISETLLGEWIRQGLFPRGVPWTGREPRWRWIDVVYREVYLEVEARLAVAEGIPPADPGSARMSPDEPGSARKGSK